MLIAINAASATTGGAATATRALVQAFPSVDGGRHSYLALVSPELRASLTPSERVKLWEGVPGHGRTARLVREQLLLPARTLTEHAAVVLHVAPPISFATAAPQVLMFQNVAPYVPEGSRGYRGRGALRLKAIRALGIASARRAKRVVFISDFQQQAILPQLGVPAERAARVYLASSPGFNPAAKERAPAVLAKHGLRLPYVLNVSQFYAYQNVVTLVEAFASAAAHLPPETLLVLAGPEREPRTAARVHDAVAHAGLADRVRFLGHVPHDELAPLLAGAALFVFPSTCESYPVTLVEALASGVPVLTSRLGPMPELAGDGARYFDAYSPAVLAKAMVDLWRDPAAQRELGRLAVARAAAFSWDETARGLLRVLEDVAAQR